MMAAFKIFNTILICCICIKLVFTSPFHNTCEDQLLSYRKFILTAVLNFEDICDATTLDDAEHSAGEIFTSSGKIIRSDDIQSKPEVWAFFRMLMAQFKDAEFISILKDAIIEKCKEKSQNDKRDGVVIGKKQRFHSWGGKRSNNPLNNGLYTNSGIRNDLGSNLEATKYAWPN